MLGIFGRELELEFFQCAGHERFQSHPNFAELYLDGMKLLLDLAMLGPEAFDLASELAYIVLRSGLLRGGRFDVLFQRLLLLEELRLRVFCLFKFMLNRRAPRRDGLARLDHPLDLLR